MDIKIYGAIGYTILYDSDLFKDIEILLISDVHEEFIKKCDSNEEISINKYIKDLLDKDYTIILEEIPNNKELEELFPTSNHVKELRTLYLNNFDKITGIDIRLDIIDITNIKNYDNILIIKLLNIYNFYLLNNNFLKKCSLYNKKIEKSILKDYYLKLIKKFLNFIYYCDDDLYKQPKYISPIKIEIIVSALEEILSDIMEFYTIIVLYDKINDLLQNNKPKKIVIYCGLYHIEQLEKYIIEYFKFKIKKSDGIVKMNSLINKYFNDICIKYIDF
jgi:hypothetical protein